METGSFTYDANGNVLTAPAPYGISAVSYEHLNLPISLTSNGVTTSYRYDAAGHRIAKQVAGGNTEVYVLDGASTLGVVTVTGSGTPTSWFFNLLAGDRAIGRQPNVSSRRHYHTDLLGSTRAVVEAAAIVESYDPEPWGLLLPGRTLGSGTKEGFTGKERDAESRLDYFGARLYMPAIARWMSVDPLAEKHPEWSPYSYVLDNPLALLDPDGRQVRATRGGGIDPAMRMPGVGVRRPGQFVGVAARGGGKAATVVAQVAVSLVPLGRIAGGVVGTATDAATGNLSVGGTVVNIVTGGKGRTVEALSDATRVASKVGNDAAQEGVDRVVTVSRSRFPEASSHIDDAQAAGHPSQLTVGRAGASARRDEALRDTPARPGLDRDEYPPAMFEEGGKGASVRHIDPKDNRGAGACVGRQCRGLSEGARVEIKTVPE